MEGNVSGGLNYSQLLNWWSIKSLSAIGIYTPVVIFLLFKKKALRLETLKDFSFFGTIR